MPRANLAVVPDLERELNELYGLPLGEFTSARNELARRLKKAGQAAEAEAVGRLAKPSISAWAINRVARVEADAMRQLLVAGQAVVDAQKQALSGGGAEAFDKAGRRQREAVRTLQRAAERVLTEAGHRPTDAVKERVASSLRAASMDPEGRELLERGRFAEDFESTGLGLLAGFAPTRSARTAAPRSVDERRDARVREAREKAESARAKTERLAEEAAQAERDVENAKAAAAQAAERASVLAKEAKAAAKDAEAAEKALERLERK